MAISLYEKKEDCCGCGNCQLVCPVHAVELVNDVVGNEYPLINKEKCIECGKCLSVCRYKKDDICNQIEKFHQDAYIGIASDEDILMNTASGGIFTTLAEAIINCGGVVVGAAWGDNGELSHILVSDVDGIKQLQGSKYVRSKLKSIFVSIKTMLNEGKVVLFSGTPCQVSALRAYLSKEYENLFLVDLICHGTPDQHIFKEYLKKYTKKGVISDIKFRNKEYGWGYSNLDLCYKNGTLKTIKTEKSSYFTYFLWGKIYRENCYSCPYSNQKRYGDITIGDFWGVEKYHINELRENKIDTNKGVSCVLVNSERGQKLIDKYGQKLKLIPSSFEKCSEDNLNLRQPCEKPIDYEKIYTGFSIYGYMYVEIYYKMGELKSRVVSIIPRCVKNIIKKVLRRN